MDKNRRKEVMKDLEHNDDIPLGRTSLVNSHYFDHKKSIYNKLFRSAIIGLMSISIVGILKQLFPAFDFAQYETAILTAFLAWMVNTIKEVLRK